MINRLCIAAAIALICLVATGYLGPQLNFLDESVYYQQ